MWLWGRAPLNLNTIERGSAQLCQKSGLWICFRLYFQTDFSTAVRKCLSEKFNKGKQISNPEKTMQLRSRLKKKERVNWQIILFEDRAATSHWNQDLESCENWRNSPTSSTLTALDSRNEKLVKLTFWKKK